MNNLYEFVQKYSLDQLTCIHFFNVLINQSNNHISDGLINQSKNSKSNQFKTDNNKIAFQLRGGGCGQTKQSQKVEEKVILNVPNNFLTILEKNVNIINSKAALILDTQQRNEVIISIQWFICNREHLNSCCKSENITSSIYTNILNYFQSFLKILHIYLRSSWFLCYQILQICNDFLRIIYTFQVQNEDRQMELTLQQELLQDLEEFKNQFEIEEATLWKTGIEYEITLIKIMLMNCQTNSEEGKNLLINIVKNLVQSAFQLSPTEELIPSLIEGAKFLFLQYKDKVLYPEEVYATYYLFQTIKWSIVRLLKQQYSVNNQIKQLKDAFQQYILYSDNWIIHFSWIQMIIDLIAYRPIIDKLEIFKNQPNEQQQVWTSLIDNNMIHSLSFNRNCASIVLYQNQIKYIKKETKDFIEQQGTFKFKLLSEFLLKGQVTQQINIWDFYKEFSFQKKKDTIIKDYEMVLANNNLLILEKEIQLFNYQLEELTNTQQQIQDSLINYFSQSNNSQLDIKLLQDDQTVLIRQLIEAYKLAIYHLNFIIELSTIDFEKLKLLLPYLQQFSKESQKSIKHCTQKLEEFIKVEFVKLQKKFLLSFLSLIEYLSHINHMSLNITTKKQSDFKQINQQFLDQGYLNFNQHQKISQAFEQFLIDIKELQKKFSLCLSNLKSNNQNIQINSEQINSMSIAACSGKWIQIIREELIKSFLDKFSIFQIEVKSIQDIQTILINCTFCIQILKIMKQFYQVHEYKVKSFEQKINEEKGLEIQQQDQFNKDFTVMIITALTQQKENLALLLKQKQIQQNPKLCKEKFKQTRYQLNQDYNTIQNEYKKVSFQSILDMRSRILTLISDAQFITLQNYNEAQNIEALSSLLQQYEQQIDEISRVSNSLFQDGHSQEYRRTIQEEITGRQYQDFCLICVDQDFQQVKITQPLLQLLDELITLNINLINLNSIDNINQINNLVTKIKQLDGKLNIQTQINNLINILSGDSKASNCYCIINNAGESVLDYPIIKSTLQETLDIFLLKSSSQEKLQIKLDPLYVNVINNLCQQIVQKKSLFDVYDFSNDYKIRECFVYNLIRLQQGSKEEQLLQFSQKFIQYFWVFEKDQKVRNLLKNQELKEMQKTIFSKDIKSISDSIRSDMKLKMQNIERIQQEIRLEGNQQIKDQLKQQLLLAYEELDHYNDNINEMSEKMEISLIFLKDISRDVKSIKISIDEIQNSIQQVGDDIRKLRGKSYKELLEIRKQKILLQSKLTEVDSVYVQLQTIEYDPITGEPVNVPQTQDIVITNLMMDEQNNFDGEVNEFIWDEQEQKDVLLLYGNAGSGKSKAAKKIEEFIWKLKGNSSKWTPIFVSLPTLKNPKYNLFEQALESENYQFDKYQIRDFKEAIQTKKEFIILILDSYDEMKQDCIQSNLITTNKLIQDLNIESKDKQVKVIITTRREILNTLGYQTWFYGESLQSLKEVKIEDFNQKQKDDYLFQYAELSVKRKLRTIYDFLKQISNKNFDLDEFLQMWNLIKNEVQRSISNSQKVQLDSIFENSQVDELIKKLVDNSLFKQLKEEQITGLRKDLSSLWSVHKFEKAIQNVGIVDLLSTPFMLEIIVQVLPKMTKQQDGSVEIKNRFIQSYLNREKQLYLSQQLIDNYKNIKDDQKEDALIKKPIYDGKKQKFKIYQEFDLDKYDTKIYDILDYMESIKFFQSYSITSILKIEDSNLIVDNNPFDIGYQYRENLELILHALNLKKFTIFEFYESFINFYHDQQIQKLREMGKISNWESFQADILQFSSNLSLDMTVNQLSQISYQQKGKLKLTNNYNKQYNADDWLDEYFDDSQQEHEYNKLIRSCILLNAKGSIYSFTHKSIQEFFAAKYILEVILTHHSQRLNKNLLEIKEQNESKELKEEREEKENKRLLESLYNQSKMNLSEDHYLGILSFIKDKLKSVDNISNTLIEIVKLSRNNKFMISASNSMYLLSYLDIYLEHEDFSEIQLINTDISGLSFFSSNFRKSKFNNVQINSCNFNLADLTDAEWKDIVEFWKKYCQKLLIQ